MVAAPGLELLVVREYGCDRPGTVKLDRGVEMDSVEGPHLNRDETAREVSERQVLPAETQPANLPTASTRSECSGS